MSGKRSDGEVEVSSDRAPKTSHEVSQSRDSKESLKDLKPEHDKAHVCVSRQ